MHVRIYFFGRHARKTLKYGPKRFPLFVRRGVSLRLPARSSSITANKGFQNKHHDVTEI
jgi:hypothetical protein